MTKRSERIEKAERAVIEAAKVLQFSGLSRDISGVARAVNLLKRAEASGAPAFDLFKHPHSALIGTRKTLKALLDAPDFSRELVLEWLKELEAR